MNNIREIRGASANIADGLEALAADIRAGKHAPRHVIVVLEELEDDHVVVGAAYFGNQRNAPQLIGMLECAKHNILTEQP